MSASYQWTLQDYLYVSAECVTGVLSTLGNLLVLLAIYKTPTLRTITNCFIGSLAAADTLVGIILPPTVILPYRGLPTDFYGCILVNTVVILITNISILNLLAVALERYLAISDPFRYQRIMTVGRAMALILVIWIIAIVLGLVPMMGWHGSKEDYDDICAFTKVIDMKFMVCFVFFVINIVPFTFIIIIYCYIFHIIRKQLRAIAQVTIPSLQQNRQTSNQKREQRGAKALGGVIILFAVCWLPLHIMNCVTLFNPEKQASTQLLLAAIVLSHANSVINPFLYAFSNSKFKVAMMRILLFGRCQSCYSKGKTDRGATLHTTTKNSNGTGGDISRAVGHELRIGDEISKAVGREPSHCVSSSPDPVSVTINNKKDLDDKDTGIDNVAFDRGEMVGSNPIQGEDQDHGRKQLRCSETVVMIPELASGHSGQEECTGQGEIQRDIATAYDLFTVTKSSHAMPSLS